MLRQERQRYPVCVGAGLLQQTCGDIRDGKTHCVVWAAGGLGWEKPQGVDLSASGAPLTQQALLEAYLEAQRKAAADRGGFARAPVVVVAMPHGARRAAAALHAQGVQTVLWVGESLFEEERAALVLFGLIVPILTKLQEPGWWKASSEMLSRMVVETGQFVLGEGWDKGGCFVPHTGLPPLPKWSPSPPNQLWVHNVAPHLLRPSGSKEAVKKESAGFHESLKLVVAEEDGARFELLKECTTDNLLTWLGDALPGDSRLAKELVAALYEDEDGAAGERLPCLQMRLSIGDVGFLHELRDAVLTLGPNPNPNPNPKPNKSLNLNLTSTPTLSQTQALTRCSRAHWSSHSHARCPAARGAPL